MVVYLHICIFFTIILWSTGVEGIGVSRPKRLNNETELLNKVAELMKHVREKDVGNAINSTSQLAEIDGFPQFSVFPETQRLDQIHIKVRQPTGFLWKKLYLEDFFDFNNLWPQFKTTQIELNTTLIVDSSKSPKEFYSQIARNLNNTLPNLVNIKLSGGFRFESKTETPDELIDKLKSIKINIAHMVETLKQHKFNVTFDKYSIDFILSEQAVKQLVENDTLHQQLGLIFQPLCIKWRDNIYTLKFSNQDATTKLIVSLGTHLPKRQFEPHCINSTTNELNCVKQVFEPNKTEIRAMDKLFLEDFVNASDFQPQTQLEMLNLSVSVASSPIYTHEQFYTIACENLKHTAPHLKTIGLYGTLRMYPAILSLYELRNELMEIKRSMEAMSRAMHQTFESVEWNEHPMFVFAIDKEILKRIQASDLIKALEVFNYSDLGLEAGKITMSFTTNNGFENRVNILITALYPQGYSFY